LQPSDYSLEDPTNATPPGRTLGAAAQPGNPVSASGAAGRARAVVEGAITSALRPLCGYTIGLVEMSAASIAAILDSAERFSRQRFASSI
jgi:hypothetical protein